jgi:glyoxylase-like metal-dependent hydrolase (beta-lactamase superfamily II)
LKQPVEICKSIYLIGDADISHPYDCCVYLLDLGNLVIIDSGAGQSFDALVKNIEKLGLKPSRLKATLATHAHIDHIGSLHRFQGKYHTQIIAHTLDSDAIESGVGIAAEAYGVEYTPCTVDLRLTADGESLKFGSYILKVIHIPGHTPGSVAAYIDIDGKRILFGQDIHGPYLPQWGANLKQAAASLKKLIALKADILCEGHFGIYQPAIEVKRYIQYYLDSL